MSVPDYVGGGMNPDLHCVRGEDGRRVHRWLDRNTAEEIARDMTSRLGEAFTVERDADRDVERARSTP